MVTIEERAALLALIAAPTRTTPKPEPFRHDGTASERALDVGHAAQPHSEASLILDFLKAARRAFAFWRHEFRRLRWQRRYRNSIQLPF